MTRNLYLGSSLGPALEAATPEAFVEGVARIYATVQYTNFPQRAEAIADEIQRNEARTWSACRRSRSGRRAA